MEDSQKPLQTNTTAQKTEKDAAIQTKDQQEESSTLSTFSIPNPQKQNQSSSSRPSSDLIPNSNAIEMTTLPGKTAAEPPKQHPRVLPSIHPLPNITNTSTTDPLAIAAAAAQASFPDLYAKGESLPDPKPPPTQPLSNSTAAADTTTAGIALPPPNEQTTNPTTVTTTTTTFTQSVPSTTTTATTSQQQQQQQQDDDDAAIEHARIPLTKLYGPYLSKTSDSCLTDARQRLKTALQQTYSLRVAFTERVYDKYRIRLHKPEPIQHVLEQIKRNPKQTLVKLRDQAEIVREEKEIEKKEAAKLNQELARTNFADRSNVLANVDSAEQLMYLTAGLNLVILPEEPTSTQSLSQAARTAHATNTKNLSQAAATAGEIILDRARKASAMRVERQRQRQLRLLRGESADDVETNYAAGLFATSPRDKLVDTNANIKKPITNPNCRRPSNTAKVGRPRAPTVSVGAELLNISPTAEEDTEGRAPSRASTLALIAKGVGSPAEKSMQRRLKHPHPDSLGGLRRANQPMPAGASPKSQHQHVGNALPPLPLPKERLERRKIQSLPPHNTIARQSVHAVLKQFMADETGGTLNVVSKIDLLNAVRKLDPGTKVASQLTHVTLPQSGATAKPPPLPDHAVYPFLTVSVFYSLGLLTRAGPGRKSQGPSKIPQVNPRNKALNSAKFKKLRDRLLHSKPTLSQRICASLSSSPAVPPVSGAAQLAPVAAASIPLAVPVPQLQARGDTQGGSTGVNKQEGAIIPAQNIRGGGEIMPDQNSGDPEGKRKSEDTTSSETVAGSLQPGETALTALSPSRKRRRPSSSPTLTANNEASAPVQDTSTRSLANEVSARQSQPPSDGYYSSYFGGLPTQQGLYDMPTLLAAGTAQGQLQSLGFARSPGMMGYTIQERAAAARVLLNQDQRTLLGGYGHTTYGPIGHHAAMPAYLGPATISHTTPAHHPTSLPSVEAKQLKRPNPGTSNRVEPEPKRAKQDDTRTSVATPAQKQQQNSVSTTTKDKKPAESEEKPPSSVESKSMVVPPNEPLPLSDAAKEMIKAGAFYLALEHIRPNQQQLALDYLSSTGSTVPIPNNLVLGPLKERLNTPGFKGLVSREIVSAAILTWLWHFHKETFKQAFEKNGRIDVDPNCKWLIQAAVSTSMGELSLDIAESVARGTGAFAEAKQAAASTGAPNRQSSTVALHISTAATVSRSLNVKMRIDEGINSVLSRYEDYVDLLDETRMGALRARTRERSFLMALMSRNTMVTEPFSNAYTSAMIRSSEALGHDGLVDICQDDSIAHSTLLPYDMLADENGAWEDPCKPSHGSTEKLTGDELMRKAHARASVQKSLRGLQEKFRIRGGTPGTGAYADPLDPREPQAVERIGMSPRQLGTRDSRRRASTMLDAAIPAGSGSVAAWSWSVYDPNHISSPIDWSVSDANNGPYGVHGQSRAFSIAAGKMSDRSDKPLKVSTTEINWLDIASTFQSVEIPKRRQRSHSHNHHDSIPSSGPIVAPYVQRVDDSVLSATSGEEESDIEEDLREERFLANHKIVLDEMKTRLDAFFESRKKHQENRRSRSNK